jgi:hypothetical protein
MLLYPLMCVALRYSSVRAATNSRQKSGMSATTEEEWVAYDTLYFMQQIDAVPQQPEE